MRRTVFYAVTVVMAITVVFTACKDKKPDNSNNNNNNNGGNENNSLVVDANNVIDGSSDIAKVKAYVLNFDEYLVASSDYTNNGFKMTLSSVPNRYLLPAVALDFPLFLISDKSAKMADVEFIAYDDDNSTLGIGGFHLEDQITDNEAHYFYADRNFTVKGTYDGDKYDCTFKKGWNIMYETDEGVSTQKPSGASYVWVYYNWGGWDDYSTANQKNKSRFPAKAKREKNRR